MISIRSGLLILICILTLSTACQKKPDEDVIARWNSVQLSEPVFKTQYVRFISTAPLKDSMENRKDFARRLLERKIIANAASNEQLDTLKVVRETIERKREIEMAKQYIRSQIEPRVKTPTERELREAFERTNTKVKLQQIYASKKEQIDTYYKQLSNDPSSFDSLAQESMTKAGESAETYNMGWVAWNEMDLAPEVIAFNLKTGTYSPPVQSMVGWHIFKVIDKEQTFFADNTTYQNSKEGIAATLERRRFEEASVRYIDSVLAQTELAMYPQNLIKLWNYLAPKLPANSNDIVAVLNREANTFNGDNIPPDLTLAVLDGQPFTVNDFMKRLPNVPYWQLQPNMRSAVESLLKDKLFGQKASQNGFSDHPEVKKETEIERVRILNLAYKSAVADTLNLNRIRSAWFENWKSNYVAEQVVSLHSYSFQDSAKSRLFLKAYLQEKNKQDVLDKFKDDWELQKETVSSVQEPSHPAFGFNLSSDKTDTVNLWGPFYLDENGNLSK